MTLVDCLEAFLKRALIVLRLELVGVFTSQILPIISISAFLAFSVLVGFY